MGWLKLGKLAIDVENWVMEVGTPDFVSFELLFVSKNHQQSDWILDSLVAEIVSFLTMCPCSVYLWLLLSYGRLMINAIEVRALSPNGSQWSSYFLHCKSLVAFNCNLF